MRVRNPAAKNEESGSRSSSGDSSSESEEETSKAKPDGVPPEAPSETDPNASQTPSIPEVNNKDFKDEQRSNHHDFTRAQDVDFGVWRDCEISKGHDKWAKWDKMTCNHVDPHKRVKHLGEGETFRQWCEGCTSLKLQEEEAQEVSQQLPQEVAR